MQTKYAFKVIDPAVFSPEKYEPKHFVIVLAGFLPDYFWR